MKNLLEVKNINKNFGNHIVLQDISFKIKPGEIVGLVGRNGMGKTTLMKCVLGLIHTDSGEILFKEKTDYYKDKARMDEIGYLLDCKMFENLNAYENIKIQEWYKGNRYRKAEEKKVIEDILSLVDLQNDKKKVKQYSFGMKQRLGLALALLGDKELLILDEPFVGLDPIGIRQIREFILKLCREREMAILISSHQLSEIEDICERYLLIANNKITDYRYDNQKKVLIYVKEEIPVEIKMLIANQGFEQDKNKISFWFEEQKFNEIMECLVKHHIRIKDVELYKDNLESLFWEDRV